MFVKALVLELNYSNNTVTFRSYGRTFFRVFDLKKPIVLSNVKALTQKYL